MEWHIFTKKNFLNNFRRRKLFKKFFDVENSKAKNRLQFPRVTVKAESDFFPLSNLYAHREALTFQAHFNLSSNRLWRNMSGQSFYASVASYRAERKARASSSFCRASTRSSPSTSEQSLSTCRPKRSSPRTRWQ